MAHGITEQESEFVSPAQFSSLTGLSLSTVWRRLAAGDIPKVQPGGRRCRVLIPRPALASLAALEIVDEDSANSMKSESGNGKDGRDFTCLPGPSPRWKQSKTQCK